MLSTLGIAVTNIYRVFICDFHKLSFFTVLVGFSNFYDQSVRRGLYTRSFLFEPVRKLFLHVIVQLLRKVVGYLTSRYDQAHS